MKTLLTAFTLLFSLCGLAQPDKKSVVIGAMTTKSNALLIINPQQSDQGVLLPQLTSAQRLAIKPSSTENGLIVFDENDQSYYYWSNGSWKKIDTQRESRFYTLDPVDFRELKPDDDIRHDNMVVFESDNTFVTANRDGKGEQIVAPVNLPHGSQIKEFTIYYMDNHANSIKAYLMRKSFLGASEEIVAWESSGMNPLVSNQSFTTFKGKEVIDLENYSYRIVVKFDLLDSEEVNAASNARQRVYGIRIKYQE